MSAKRRFEWDNGKARSNARKHHITFAEAATVFADVRRLDVFDARHAEDEDRWLLIGISSAGKLLVVSYAERDTNVRIISARPATRAETNEYRRQNR